MTHRMPGARFPGGGGGRGGSPYLAGDLADAMRKDPKMKVFSANGYFDLATPFFITEYDLEHMMLTPALAKNVEFGYYPSGHMVYLNTDALKEFKHDLAGFYTETGH
jgi:carboxypeptidase C (cathepsin A)